MRQIIIILTFLFFFNSISYGQSNPKYINEVVALLQINCPDSLKNIIKIKPVKKFLTLAPLTEEYEILFRWVKIGKPKSKFQKYLIRKGISYSEHQQLVVLTAFKKSLLEQPFTEMEIINPYKLLEIKYAQEDKNSYTLDTLRGQYIPKDLEDCFKQIDSRWSDSIKTLVKSFSESKFLSESHLAFGMWIRNNWKLWGRSRLSKYFNDKGIFHADDMSGIILTSYHRYLFGKEIHLNEQIKRIQDYWKVSKKPLKDSFPKGAKKFEFFQKICFTSKINGEECIHVGTNTKSEMIWLYDYYRGWVTAKKEDLSWLKESGDTIEARLMEIYSRDKN